MPINTEKLIHFIISTMKNIAIIGEAGKGKSTLANRILETIQPPPFKNFTVHSKESIVLSLHKGNG